MIKLKLPGVGGLDVGGVKEVVVVGKGGVDDVGLLLSCGIQKDGN